MQDATDKVQLVTEGLQGATDKVQLVVEALQGKTDKVQRVDKRLQGAIERVRIVTLALQRIDGGTQPQLPRLRATIALIDIEAPKALLRNCHRRFPRIKPRRLIPLLRFLKLCHRRIHLTFACQRTSLRHCKLSRLLPGPHLLTHRTDLGGRL